MRLIDEIRRSIDSVGETITVQVYQRVTSTTEEADPLAVLDPPPLTDETNSLAVLNEPPLTEE